MKIKDLLFEVDFVVFAGVNLKSLLRKKDRKHLSDIIRGVSRVKEKSRFSICIDMFVKCLCSSASFNDYAYLRFYDMTIREARGYLNSCRFSKVQRYLRSPEVKKLLNDKARFLDTFREFTKRDFLYITATTTPNELTRFIEQHSEFIAKPNNLNAGRGIELVDSRSFPNVESLLACLWKKQTVLLEEVIENHTDLKKFSERSLNTMRIIAVRTEEGVKILRAFLRFNITGGITDNISAGGYACPINTATGKLYDGMTNRKELSNAFMPYHPKGFTFEGEQIPFWDETVALVTKAMIALKMAFFVAWDIAVTPDGPIVIEANNSPGYTGFSSIPNYKEVKKAYRFAKKNMK